MGGCSTAVLEDSITRVPAFSFKSISDALVFKEWLITKESYFKEIVKSSSNYAKLIKLKYNIEANHLYLFCEYFTQDASGQNMVTIATQQIFEYILENTPVTIEYAFVESNMSGDKKASALSLASNRGKKVSAEIILDDEMIKKYLHTDAKTMQKYWQMSALGAVMSGAIGVQGHYANALCALFIATGQDVACVAEASVGITRFELKDDNSLYASVTLPNLIVGTVGGGTQLSSQASALEILKLPKQNSAKAFSEIAASLVLAGELSIIGSLCANDFTKAHKKRAR